MRTNKRLVVVVAAGALAVVVLFLALVPGEPPPWPLPRNLLQDDDWYKAFAKASKGLDIEALREDARPAYAQRILDIYKGSKADEHGLVEGDLLCSINGAPVQGGDSVSVLRKGTLEPDAAEVWTAAAGRRTLAFPPRGLGFTHTPHWLPELAYARSGEMNPDWDDYILVAARNWVEAPDLAETALRHAADAGYRGWFVPALMVAICQRLGDNARALQYGGFLPDELPPTCARPVFKAMFEAFLSEGDIEKALAVYHKHRDLYVIPFSWNPRSIEKRFKRLTARDRKIADAAGALTEPPGAVTWNRQARFGSTTQQLIDLLEERGSATVPIEPGRWCVLDFGPGARNVSFEIEFRYHATDPKAEPESCGLHVKLMDASPGKAHDMAEVLFGHPKAFTVRADEYPAFHHPGSKQIELIRNRLKIVAVGPWCQIDLNGTRIFRGVLERHHRQLFCSVWVHGASLTATHVRYATLPDEAAATAPRPVASRPAERAEMPKRPDAGDLAWFYDTFVGGYVKSADRDGPWDAEALTAAWLAARHWGRDAERVEPCEVLRAAEGAVEAGCADPLITFIHAEMTSKVRDYSSARARRQIVHAAAGVIDGDLPVALRFWILNEAVNLCAGARFPPTIEKAGEFSLAATRLIPELLDDDEAPAWFVRDIYPYISIGRSKKYADRTAEFERFYTATAAARPTGSLAHTLKGYFYVGHAWEARGGGWASEVTKEGWRLFRERLLIAKESLLEATRRDPDNGHAWAWLITVSAGLSEPLEQQVAYLDRALDADVNNARAYENALWFLRPRWGGSYDAMRVLARAVFERVRDTPGADALMALVLVDAEAGIAADLRLAGDDSIEEDARAAAHWVRPEVWPVVKEAYDFVLERRPRSRMSMTAYLYDAYKCEKLDVASGLLEKLGGDVATGALRWRGHIDRVVAVLRERERRSRGIEH